MSSFDIPNKKFLCDFCQEEADYGFDYEWDALLCWLCHLSQNFAMWFTKYNFKWNGRHL